MRRTDLTGNFWTVRTGSAEAPAGVRGREVPATVPGCVHTDLLRAGLIPDPLVGTNESETLWIGECDWEYSAAFTLGEDDLAPRPGEARAHLVCEGLDTLAAIAVNGHGVGAASNMFVPHRFEVTGLLRPGPNAVQIRFGSPLKYIRAERDRLGPRPVNGDWDPYIFIRKQASSFGWDWAPKLPTCGVWRPLRIEWFDRARITGLRPRTRRIDEARWLLEVDVDLEWAEGAEFSALRLNSDLDFPQPHAHVARSVAVAPFERTARIVHEVINPMLWWPRGYGEQPLHRLRVFLDEFDGDSGHGISQATADVGFRDVALNTTPDEHGTPFELRVNGRPIFCQGANWIPDGPYAANATDRQVQARVRQAASMGMNMLRVWGGGVYESDAFYRECDERGILVWQDFMFACAMYPEEHPYPELIESEARHQIARLSPHPSVVLWCGGNECTWAHEAWGNAPGERPWKERLEGRTWGRHYYFDLLPRLLQELDPSRPYWPNSPWPGREGLGGNSAHHADRHTWDLSLEGYTTIVPRFLSEFGHQAPASRTTLLTALAPQDLRLGSAAFEHHQRATGGTDRHITSAIREVFGKPRDFNQWHLWAQLLQARAVYTGFAWARVNRPRCMGALVWQLNDCWPGMSWSLIDARGVEKPAAAAARHALAPRQLFILSVEGSPRLYAVNDTEEWWDAPLHARRISYDRHTLSSAQLTMRIPPRGAQCLGCMHDLVGAPSRPHEELCTAESGPCVATAFYVKDKERRAPAPLTEVDQLVLTHYRDIEGRAGLATSDPILPP